jgi:hypothetical protein
MLAPEIRAVGVRKTVLPRQRGAGSGDSTPKSIEQPLEARAVVYDGVGLDRATREARAWGMTMR